jgi:hypothetical protein
MFFLIKKLFNFFIRKKLGRKRKDDEGKKRLE